MGCLLDGLASAYEVVGPSDLFVAEAQLCQQVESGRGVVVLGEPEPPERVLAQREGIEGMAQLEGARQGTFDPHQVSGGEAPLGQRLPVDMRCADQR